MYPAFIKYKNIQIPDIAWEFWDATLRYEKTREDLDLDRNKHIFKPSDNSIYENDITGEKLRGEEARKWIYEDLASKFVNHIYPDFDTNSVSFMPQSGYLTVGSSVTEHIDVLMFSKDPFLLALTDMHIEVNRKLYPIQKGDVWSIPTNLPHSVPVFPTDMKWTGVRMRKDPYSCSIEHLSHMFEHEHIDYVDLTQIKGGLRRAWGNETVKGSIKDNKNLMAKSPHNIDVDKLRS